MNAARWLSILFVGAITAAACGGGNDDDGDNGNDAGAAGAGGAADGTGGSSGGTGGKASGGSAGTTDCGPCDDGFDCTVDACASSSCRQTIGPNEGATACPPGEYCTVEEGCVRAPACATTADCEEAWADDPCKANVRCDAASSVCLFDLLDKDLDRHAPQVCGGADCNDDDRDVSPSAFEACNGADDNCNGRVDEDDEDPCGLAFDCIEGDCVCRPELLCGADCVQDIDSDPRHCGACGNACPSNGGDCMDGECFCPSGSMPCGDRCAYTNREPENCGACGNECPAPMSCEAGECVCSGTLTDCGGECVDISTDEVHCGDCGESCRTGESCFDGGCVFVNVPTDTSQAGIDAFLTSFAYQGSGWRAASSAPADSDLPHGRYRVWMNEPLIDAQATSGTAPVGSMAVNEMYASNTVIGRAAMLRTETSWLYYCVASEDGRCWPGSVSGVTGYDTSTTNCGCHGGGTVVTVFPTP